MEHFSYKGGWEICGGLHILRHLKLQLVGLQINDFGLFVIYRIAGKFAGKKFGELIDQPRGY